MEGPGGEACRTADRPRTKGGRASTATLGGKPVGPMAAGCTWHHNSQQTCSIPNLLGRLAPTMTSPLCLLRHLASTSQMRLELSAAGASQEINTQNQSRAKVRLMNTIRVYLCYKELTTWAS